MSTITPREKVLIALAVVGAAIYIAALIASWCASRGAL